MDLSGQCAMQCQTWHGPFDGKVNTHTNCSSQEFEEVGGAVPSC
jgi:hypothetical protein